MVHVTTARTAPAGRRLMYCTPRTAVPVEPNGPGRHYSTALDPI